MDGGKTRAARPGTQIGLSPKKHRFCVSNGSSWVHVALRRCGSDSPVSAALSTRKSSEQSRTRRSAGTRSPAETRTTSPGTTRSAATSSGVPSRTTRTRGGSMSRKPAMRFSDVAFWTKEKIPVVTTTNTNVTPKKRWSRARSRAYPTKHSAAPPHSNREKKPVSSRRNRTHTGVRRGGVSRLGPCFARAARAASAVRPR